MHLDRCAMVDTQTYKFGLLDRINQRKRNVNIYLNNNNSNKKNGNIFIANTQEKKKLCRDRCEYVLPNRCWSALGYFFCSLYFVLCCVFFYSSIAMKSTQVHILLPPCAITCFPIVCLFAYLFHYIFDFILNANDSVRELFRTIRIIRDL